MPLRGVQFPCPGPPQTPSGSGPSPPLSVHAPCDPLATLDVFSPIVWAFWPQCLCSFESQHLNHTPPPSPLALFFASLGGSASWFLSLSTPDLWDEITLCCGDCPTVHRVLGVTARSDPLWHLSRCHSPRCLQTLPSVPWGGLGLRINGLQCKTRGLESARPWAHRLLCSC